MKMVRAVKRCRICHSEKLYKFLDLGAMPVANGFLKKEQLKKPEAKYPLGCSFCENCSLVQLTHVVDPVLLFQNYLYIPSTAQMMINNFSNLAYQANKALKIDEKSLILDIGSNDGSLLSIFKGFGSRVLGVDPAEKIAKLAEMRGIPTEVALFNLRLAKKIVKKYGQADLVTGTNVVAHIDNLHELLGGVSHLLKDGGLFITEFPYLLDLISKNQFDTIYHEHLSYFAVSPWKRIIEEFGFEIVDVRRLAIHGGSLRLTHRRKKKRNPARQTVEYLMSLERHHGLYQKARYDRFTREVEKLKFDLLALLKKLKGKNKKIVGYGAAAKGNVLTNYFNIGRKTLDYIVDSTSYKQGLFTPGKHIPVFAEAKLLADMPDYALILAWNFADEIIKKQEEFRRRGGKFIIPVPEVKII